MAPLSGWHRCRDKVLTSNVSETPEPVLFHDRGFFPPTHAQVNPPRGQKARFLRFIIQSGYADFATINR